MLSPSQGSLILGSERFCTPGRVFVCVPTVAESVPVPARDQVKMHVLHHLPGGPTVVLEEVEPLGPGHFK